MRNLIGSRWLTIIIFIKDVLCSIHLITESRILLNENVDISRDSSWYNQWRDYIQEGFRLIKSMFCHQMEVDYTSGTYGYHNIFEKFDNAIFLDQNYFHEAVCVRHINRTRELVRIIFDTITVGGKDQAKIVLFSCEAKGNISRQVWVRCLIHARTAWWSIEWKEIYSQYLHNKFS